MIKKITTLVNENKNAIIRKTLIIGGVALGIVAGALLVKPDEDVIIGEVVDGEFTIREKTPEEKTN
jgi:hypothetical protein